MKAKYLSPTKGVIRSLVDCLTSPDGVSGFFDVEAFLELSKRKRRERRARAIQHLALDYILEEEEARVAGNNNKPPRAKRSCQKLVNVSMFDKDGNVVPLDPKYSTWYITYCSHPRLSAKHFHTLFRRRFRLPYKEYLQLVEDARESGLFVSWEQESKDAMGNLPSPMELMVLGSLRYLGRGWTFDDLQEATGIDAETHRKFFHTFVKFGSTILFDRYVRMPTNKEEAVSPEYHQAGLPGCVGSMDASHIILEKVPQALKQMHLGFKDTHTARTYNIVVNHRRRILSSTRGHPARWNDKTLVLFDDFATALRNGSALDDVEFVLLERSANGVDVVERKYRGAYLITDNGYLAWSCTIPPIKSSSSEAEIRFSQWIESLRKDVECTFGILKGRFRILKAGIRLHGVETADKIWLTCCALHNWLLEVDGLDQPWDGSLGQFDSEDCDLPSALGRLTSPAQARTYDTSGNGRGDDGDDGVLEVDEEVLEAETEDGQGVRHIRKMPMKLFRLKLIEHFMILRQRGHLKWPRKKK
jgi:DDE superfamily endonuclease